MNILFFIPELSQEGGGIRQYAITLLKILSKDTSNKYYILHNKVDPQIATIVYGNENMTIIPSSIGKERWHEWQIKNFFKLYNFIGNTSGRGWKIKNWSYVQRICSKYKIDLVHSPFQQFPYANVKTIWTLHDVQELHFPEYFSPVERESRARTWVDNMNRRGHIIVSYNHIKNDIIKYFQQKESNISVCLLNMQELWFSSLDDSDIDYDYLKTLPERYLLYPANTWAHKNHLGLVKALKILIDQNIQGIKIICTGHKNDFFEKEIWPFVKENNLESHIYFLGILEEKKLFSLYKKAHGVIVPTKYEAGSFPLMESIFLDVPVVCSNVTSLPETIGNSMFLFNPDSDQEIANIMVDLFYNNDFRNANKLNLKIQKAKLINHDVLEQLIAIYNQVGKQDNFNGQ